ncbi:MAG TPA: cytochrome c oxidase subunit II [Thermoanaerobaculia bacterium]|nr:cytochrome c oxidase subunit II [Thermoanaerobaculia bacterium]
MPAMSAMSAILIPDWVGRHSAIASAGPQAGRIEGLWWLMFWVSTAVFVAVMVALGGAMARRPRILGDSEPPHALTPEERGRMNRLVGGAVAVTVVILFVLLVASVGTGRAIASLSAPHAPIVKVTGHQWWWQVEYVDAVPGRSLTTANEIHIPVGRPVLFRLQATDVIHSFWVPNLHGKRDMIPGHDNEIWIQADRPGVYRGQCAEFCGFQHAHMGLLVIAEPPAQYEAWYKSQLQPAATPVTARQERGRQLVQSLPCALCHNVQGSQASGKTGPDLTHLASRRTIAAGTLPNTRGNLAGWILDPQTVKPGNHMPANTMASDDLQALLDYLEILK